jgi:hypothetical protein
MRFRYYGTHHNTVVNGCPKVKSSSGLLADVKLQFPGSHDHLNSLLTNSFCGAYASTVDTFYLFIYLLLFYNLLKI